MKKQFIAFAALATILLVCPGQSAVIRPDDEDNNAWLLRTFADSSDFTGELPEKRYANNFYTNVKSKHFDKAALLRFLHNRYVQKRFSSPMRFDFDGASLSQMENVPQSGIVGFRINFLPIIDDATNDLPPLTSSHQKSLDD